jgi:hypothetical protein
MLVVQRLECGSTGASFCLLSQCWKVDYVVAAVLTLIALAVTSVGAVMLVSTAFSSAEDIDPFASYDAIMPGQPMTAVAHYSCTGSYLPLETAYREFYCQIRPSNGPFLSVSIVGQDDMIQALSFTVKGLRVGDLIQRWGRPSVVQKRKRYYLIRWGEAIYATVHTVGLFTYQSEVQFVSLRASRD